MNMDCSDTFLSGLQVAVRTTIFRLGILTRYLFFRRHMRLTTKTAMTIYRFAEIYTGIALMGVSRMISLRHVLFPQIFNEERALPIRRRKICNHVITSCHLILCKRMHTARAYSAGQYSATQEAKDAEYDDPDLSGHCVDVRIA
jgi:hypothetical protein